MVYFVIAISVSAVGLFAWFAYQVHEINKLTEILREQLWEHFNDHLQEIYDDQFEDIIMSNYED